MPIRIFDVECVPNWFLLLMQDTRTGHVMRWERYDDKEMGRSKEELRQVLAGSVNVSFNGLNYDRHIVDAYLNNFNNRRMFDVSMFIIHGDALAPWRVGEQFEMDAMDYRHIDVAPIAMGVASLKMYAARLDSPRIQDLPFDPEVDISRELADEARAYCLNDLACTQLLFDKLRPDIVLRREMSKLYGLKLHSKSGPQIAEAVLRSELNKQGVVTYKGAVKTKRHYTYEPPRWLTGSKKLRGAMNDLYERLAPGSGGTADTEGRITRRMLSMSPEGLCFRSDEMIAALANCLVCRFPMSPKGSLLIPTEICKRVVYRGRKYQMGVGGLHSCEKSQAITTEDGSYLFELDVVSYYPSIIRRGGYAPGETGDAFRSVYARMIDDRVAAKKAGHKLKAESTKLILNSSFGKFGNPHSHLYDPQLLLQTTVTGQLGLLMLIEMLSINTDSTVVSANTDGIVVHSPDKAAVDQVLSVASSWEKVTGCVLEKTFYRSLHSQDVNNYIAVKCDGGFKTKGIFAPSGLSKNPRFRICITAIKDFIIGGVDIEETIRACRDIRQFTTVQQVNGGAMWRGREHGKTMRWYQSVNGTSITRKANGNRVGLSDHAMVVNDLPRKFPKDIMYEFYIDYTRKLMSGIGL